LDEAKKSWYEGGIPIGSALALGVKLISVGHNKRIQDNDPIAHAEIDCIRNAGRGIAYKDTTLYTTLTPCYLCSGAIVLFGIKRVVIGQTQIYDGKGSLDFLRGHGVKLIDLKDDKSITLMNNFISKKPKIWLEDIGEE
jgi:creatinine deaminase